ncbi:hypothetical protein Tco_1041147 [Tanacetum coccineum]|uniref:Uncharacterized protein n=1 Tax=Tanacetum coccineum TaxID=301880 RepID=A0ABQ5GHT0_9ASTR
MQRLQHHQELHSSPLHDLSDRIYRCKDAESNSFLHGASCTQRKVSMVSFGRISPNSFREMEMTFFDGIARALALRHQGILWGGMGVLNRWWCNDGSRLKDKFPMLFALESFKDCKVKDRGQVINGSWVGSWDWRIPLVDALNGFGFLIPLGFFIVKVICHFCCLRLDWSVLLVSWAAVYARGRFGFLIVYAPQAGPLNRALWSSLNPFVGWCF